MRIDVEGHEDKALPPYFLNAPQDLWPSRIIIEHLQRNFWTPDCIAVAETRSSRVVMTTLSNTFLEKS